MQEGFIKHLFQPAQAWVHRDPIWCKVYMPYPAQKRFTSALLPENSMHYATVTTAVEFLFVYTRLWNFNNKITQAASILCNTGRLFKKIATPKIAHFKVDLKKQHLSLTDTANNLGQCNRILFYEFISAVERLQKPDWLQSWRGKCKINQAC